MNKVLKIALLTLTSLLLIVLIAISILLWFVFTPQKLTPIVKEQVAKSIRCESQIGEVELTFFSTFPSFGLKVNGVTILNPTKGAPSDTLIDVNELTGVVDLDAWWNRNELVITDLILSQGSVNVFIDSLGVTNYDIVVADTSAVDTTKSKPLFGNIRLSHVELDDLNVIYLDETLAFRTDVHQLSGQLTGSILTDTIKTELSIDQSLVSMDYEGVRYLDKAPTQLTMLSDYILSQQCLKAHKATITVKDLLVEADGFIQLQPVTDNIVMAINYHLEEWSLKSALTLTPKVYESFVKDVQTDGLFASSGSIKGVYNDSSFPMIKAHLLLENGTLKHPFVAMPLNNIKADVDIQTDLATDSLSSVQLNDIEVSTPNSDVKLNGLVDHLYSDIHCNLSAEARLLLDEFAPLIPANLKMKLKGSVAGTVKSDFTLSQIEKQQLNKIKVSGSVTLSKLDVTYDSLSLKTGHSIVDFALPNYRANVDEPKFVFAKIRADQISVSKLNSYDALMGQAELVAMSSDVRDTTKIPNLLLSFKLDTLAAQMDTMSVAISKPFGIISLSPRYSNESQPRIKLNLNSSRLTSKVGAESFFVDKIAMDADIVNDKTQKDILSQWPATGSVDLENGIVNISSLSYPVQIPAISMAFKPESIDVKDGRMVIDKSDFELKGQLKNVLSYYKGDSVLRGQFDFISRKTDVAQLMNLTNGIGNAEVVTPEQVANYKEEAMPVYLVPKGVDISLNAKIGIATLGLDTARNIKGDVKLKNGVLVLDGLTFVTPAAKMQLTMMYKTPRKNHIFVGLDYHMIDIEIETLLKMIPEVDSIMPMLNSFKGRGEFHIVAETYLDSLYNVKMSTLRGASSIKGQNLVLMDGKTFTEIAKALKFSKKTENKVDSLEAEFTIFKKQVDVYPFLIVMDKYKAVVAGRHNLDMSYDYNISVIESPLPVKLGVDVKGNADNLDFKLTKCKYPDYYRPTSRKNIENKQIEIGRLIHEALAGKVITD